VPAATPLDAPVPTDDELLRDEVESVAWRPDTVFALACRVRLYQGYLPWELSERPLPAWRLGELLGLVTATRLRRSWCR
jgi:hypothetical protein